METAVQSIWSKSKLLVKGLIIFVLVLFLMIPTIYIRELIEERELRQKEAIAEVSSKWAGRQNIAGPLLVLPFWQYDSDSASNRTKQFAIFLPDELTIQANSHPQEKYRGIYKVMLYTAHVHIKGKFSGVETIKLNIPEQNVIWKEAFIQLKISDAKGLNDELILKWKGQPLAMSTDPVSDFPSQESLQAKLNLTGAADLLNATFSADVNLSGSEDLLFTPTGKTTTVRLSSTWPHPSFTGDILPHTTEVNDSGFTATWKSLSLKRNFPQQWKNNVFLVMENGPGKQHFENNINNAAFGAHLFVPVNGYQKTMRSVKYAVLCILLTFAAFFIIETTNKRSVHPFQYGLIGLALVMFYTVLLSFSEYTGFNIAYIIASTATIGLIAWFVKGLLGSVRLSLILSLVLLLMYTYVFTILQLQDYSLLLGSIGLFITLAVIMHFSKKIQW